MDDPRKEAHLNLEGLTKEERTRARLAQHAKDMLALGVDPEVAAFMGKDRSMEDLFEDLAQQDEPCEASGLLPHTPVADAKEEPEPAMIDPEDGLHQTFAELREQMGIPAFLDRLEKATPPGKKLGHK